VSLKAVVLGSLAARWVHHRRVVNAINGLGFTFAAKTPKAWLWRTLLRFAFRIAVDRPGNVILLQHEDDRRVLAARGFVRQADTLVVRGSGVDMDHFAVQPGPTNRVPTIAVVTRMLKIKGIGPLVEASRILRARRIEHRLVLVGRPDPENPSSITEQELHAYGSEPGIEWRGFSTDVREIWAQADIAALTSLGGEGIPKALVEAAACGRPIVTTDVSGCRDVIIDGVTGVLVPAGDPQATAAALERLIGDEAMRHRFGAEGRRHVERNFSDRIVVAEILSLYRRLLQTPRC
jgi:glycosyltransferase involved in cell wall biosynthesis